MQPLGVGGDAFDISMTVMPFVESASGSVNWQTGSINLLQN